MEKLIPDAGLVTVAGAGHYSFLENMPLFVRVLESFLAKEMTR
jgi:pimeloyl-ACP methyl ester carboxylesterase